MSDPSVETPDPAASELTTENARNGARKRRDPNEPSAVVGLGASAGGIAPLQQFFSDMSPESGLAFVVVMHLAPDVESQLAAVLQQKTKMPVTQVTGPVKVKPNHVYVIPPGQQLTFTDSMLNIVPPQQGLGRRVTIDLFFRTLAMAYGQRAVCVILSGTDSDGVIGLKHIRAQGGLTIAQDPNEAEHDSMPVTAISTGMVDWVLPVAQLAPKLLEFVHNENRMKLPPEIPEADEPDAKEREAPGGETVSDETRDPEDEDAILKVLSDVRAQTGNDFAHYKRATILRRIARRMQVNSLESIPRYLNFIRTHPLETRALLQDLLIGVTHFFRDRDSFAALEAHIPQLFAGKKKDDEVRVWVAGCATGEEAYSIAMLMTEHSNRLENPPPVQIFATDVDEQSIADARDGLYPSMIEADVSPERLREFFVKDHGRYRVRKEIREKVLFAAHNVLKDAPFSRCDLISCRNLLIYLNTSAQQQVFDIFHFALRSGGLLFLGGAENQSQGRSLFAPVDAKNRLFVRRSTPRPVWRVPNLPLRVGLDPVRQATGWRARPLPPLTHIGATDATAAAPDVPHAGYARREALFGELHLRLLEEYGPPSVVVNNAHEIVHLSGSAGRYLHFVAGEPTANIVKVINPALQVEIRTALFKAAQTKQSVTAAPKPVEIEGTTEVITLTVRPMHSSDTASGFFLVLFEKLADAPAASATEHPETDAVVTREANEEIEFLKEQLNATIEQYEGANEELKASNEELQAMNEEMRSATEELETSKEELQSVNEELTTVNYELKGNVEELSKTNADLNNLMASSDIGTIFLDRQLRIHRFTPAAQKIFNLIPSDMGRPISDLTSSLKYEGFMADAEQVLQDLHTIEREVQLGDGTWYMTRIAPYRTSEDRIAGVVATFIDITRIKRAQAELSAISHQLAAQSHRFDTIMEAVPDFIYEFDLQGRFTFVNPSLLALWGMTAEEAIGRNFHELDYTRDLATKLQGQIQEVVKTGNPLKDETPYTSQIGERMYEYLFFPIFGDGGRVEAVAGVTRDITERRQAEAALRASEERFRNVADNIPQIIWTNDDAGTADYFNKRWFDYTGLSLKESCGPGWQAIIHPADAPASIAAWQQALARGEVFDAEYRLRGADGQYRWFIGRNVPLRADGPVLSWFGTATDIDDLKQVQASLQETQERFRLLVEGAPDYAMFLIGVNDRIIYWSSGAEKIFGWTAEEAIGHTGKLIFTPEDIAAGAEERERAVAMREGAAADRRWHLRKDGSRIWVDGVLRRLNNENGRHSGFAKVAQDATQRREYEDRLRQSHEELEQRVKERTADLTDANQRLLEEIDRRARLEQEILQISEREKRRIGQDLHDSLCQELAAAAFFLQSTAEKLGPKKATEVKALTEAAKIVNDNVGLARDLARGLHPVELGVSGLTNALRELAFRTHQGVACRFECPKPIRISDDAISLNFYRIAQEAVTNALKHAKATEIVITLLRNRSGLVLTVEDNGQGITAKKNLHGMGQHIMVYRANAIGATCETSPRKGGGTCVRCVLPRK